MSVQSRHYRSAVFAMLALSFPAMLLVCCLFGFSMVYIVLTAFPVQIAVGYLCMGVFAWLVAPAWGAACTARLPLAGLSGVLVFLLGVVSGSLASVFVVRDFSFRDFAAVLYWLALCGVVPAFVIGFVGGCLTRILFPDPAA